MNDTLKKILLFSAVSVLIYLLLDQYGKKEEDEDGTIDNMENVSGDKNEEEVLPDDLESKESKESKNIEANIEEPESEDDEFIETKDFSSPDDEWLKSKFRGRNRAKKGYKKSSYIGSSRGEFGDGNWKTHFDKNNDVVGDGQCCVDDEFSPVDESNNGYANFKSKGRAPCGSNQNCDPKDLFNADNYLPQEVNEDWFDVQPEPVSVKNRHLINTTKPIGINSIANSLRNASHDIRGTIECPRFVVSPWLQSTIEPDHNIKELY